MLEQNLIDKRYIALVQGTPPEDGQIDLPIMKHDRKHYMVVSASGKSAETRYKVIERLGPFSLVELQLITGRTHQIRVHLSAIGYPLLVDPLYGNQEHFFLSSIKKNYRGDRNEERPILSRTPLHAASLSFDLFGKSYNIQSAPPKDMRATITQMQKIFAES